MKTIQLLEAKAESMQISCSGGIAERTERLMVSLTAIGLEGLGVPFALAIGIWILLILAVVTVVQRILIVKAAL
jgi:CDP-diacylglycerol---glycerol-3-phosphate 3-phosphatidyltransferase